MIRKSCFTDWSRIDPFSLGGDIDPGRAWSKQVRGSRTRTNRSLREWLIPSPAATVSRRHIVVPSSPSWAPKEPPQHLGFLDMGYGVHRPIPVPAFGLSCDTGQTQAKVGPCPTLYWEGTWEQRANPVEHVERTLWRYQIPRKVLAALFFSFYEERFFQYYDFTSPSFFYWLQFHFCFLYINWPKISLFRCSRTDINT